MKEIIIRLKAKTPKFFKRIRTIGTVLTSVCTPIVAIPTTYTGAIISDTLVKICSYLIVTGVVMVAVASLAKEDSSNDKNDNVCNQ